MEVVLHGRTIGMQCGPQALQQLVMGPLLTSDLDKALQTARKTPIKADGRTGKTWGHFSEGIKLKAFAIKVTSHPCSVVRLFQKLNRGLSWQGDGNGMMCGNVPKRPDMKAGAEELEQFRGQDYQGHRCKMRTVMAAMLSSEGAMPEHGHCVLCRLANLACLIQADAESGQC